MPNRELCQYAISLFVPTSMEGVLLLNCGMFTKQASSRLRKEFWTSFGQYMKPVAGASGQPVNWLNYKTGIRDIFFRMDADEKSAGIGIEIRHADPVLQQKYFEQFSQLKTILEDITEEAWVWDFFRNDEDGNGISRIGILLDEVNIFNRQDWPAIISFLKPRIIALDRFWDQVKERIGT